MRRARPTLASRALAAAKRRSWSGLGWSLRRHGDLARASGALHAARATTRPVVVGPFLGEVGFELLYWLPFLRRELRRLGIGPRRVVSLTRGGAGVWYEGIADRHVDLLDILDADELRELTASRAENSMTTKMLTIEAVDRELVRRAGLAGSHVLHPVLMYGRMRFLWEGSASPAHARELGSYARLSPPTTDRVLPEHFVAVKAYFSACFPDDPATRAFLSDLVRELADRLPVVLLAPDLRVDDHVEWAADDPRVHVVAGLSPASNLAEQTAIISRASALVSTYGGFSYLGPFLGVPTVAFEERRPDNLYHLDVLHAVLPDARYERVDLVAARERALALVA